MSPAGVRVPVPAAVVGAVIALCAVLLLKWLAIVALAGCALVLAVRWLWSRRSAARRAGPVRDADEPAAFAVPAPREAAGADCHWCGLAGGHRDLRGEPVRPRHAHAGELTRRG